MREEGHAVDDRELSFSEWPLRMFWVEPTVQDPDVAGIDPALDGLRKVGELQALANVTMRRRDQTPLELGWGCWHKLAVAEKCPDESTPLHDGVRLDLDFLQQG